MKNIMKTMMALALVLCLFAVSVLPAGALWDFSNGLPSDWYQQDTMEEIKATELNAPVNPHASQEAKNLLYYLQMVGDSDQFVAGQFDISTNDAAYQQVITEYGYTPSLYSNRYTVIGEDATVEPKWVMDGTTETSVLAEDNTVMDFTNVETANALMKQHYDEGAVLLIHADSVPRVVCRRQAIKNVPDLYTESNQAKNAVWELDETNPDRDMQTYVLWMEYLNNYIDALQQLEDSGVKAYMWRPWIEYNNHRIFDDYDAFVRVYQQTVNHMIEAKLTGFLVTFSPNGFDHILKRNPGTDYIDCYAFTMYSSETQLGTFRRNDFVTESYQVVQRSGKPLGFSEFSCRTGSWRYVEKWGRASSFDLLHDTLVYWPELSWVNFWGSGSYSTTNDNGGYYGNDDGLLYWSSDQALTLDEIPDYRHTTYAAPGIAQFFTTANASGGYVGLEEGTYTTAQLKAAGITPSNIQSIRVNRNFAVAMYTGDNCTGTATYYTGGNKAITADVASGFKSAKVYYMENLSIGKTATASAYSENAKNVLDDDNPSDLAKGTFWDVTFKNDTHWVRVDLGAKYDLKRMEFVLYYYNSIGDRPQYRTVENFTMQTSVDGSTWKTVHVVPGEDFNDHKAQSALIQQVEAPGVRYIRLLMNDNGQNGYLRLDEIRAFGTPSADVPVTALGAQVRTKHAADFRSLRFGFDLTAMGVSYEDANHADGNYKRKLTNPTVNINGTSYTLVDFGALVSNKSAALLTLDDANSQRVSATNLYSINGSAVCYTAVVKSIPEHHWDSPVYARAYVIYKDGNTEKVLYSDSLARSITECEYLASIG